LCGSRPPTSSPAVRAGRMCPSRPRASRSRRGSARRPASRSSTPTLWVAHTKTGGSEFYFWETSRVSPTATGWSAKVILGAENDEGRIYDIWAFFLPNDFNAFVTSLSARGMDGSSGYWFSRSLPPGVDEKPTLTGWPGALSLIRNSGRHQHHCRSRTRWPEFLIRLLDCLVVLLTG